MALPLAPSHVGLPVLVIIHVVDDARLKAAPGPHADAFAVDVHGRQQQGDSREGAAVDTKVDHEAQVLDPVRDTERHGEADDEANGRDIDEDGSGSEC
ncbi:hypothetical protein HYQ46_011782 [Verticillium longisporum]|nr:hypothetical protein HYQ46_011782 [Verticillium longisporum]